MNNALPIVHLVKLKTNELSDQTPRKSLKVEANGEPVFDDHIYDTEVQNCEWQHTVSSYSLLLVVKMVIVC